MMIEPRGEYAFTRLRLDLGMIAYWLPHVAGGICLAILSTIILLVT